VKILTLKNSFIILILILSGCYTTIFAQVDTVATGARDANKASPVTQNDPKIDSLPQSTGQYFIIRNIVFEGNRKTQDTILLRELPFKKEDSIPLEKIPELFELAKTRILNLNLFQKGNVSVLLFDPPYVDIKIRVTEKLYLLPLPYFKPVDRNLNQWLFEKGASTARVDYGAKLLWDNVTGSNDKLRFYFITGYTRQLSFGYQRPYIDKKLKWGFNINVALGKNHEVLYNTVHDKQQFIKDTNFLRNFFDSRLEFSYRKKIYTTHYFGLGFHSLRLGDTVFRLNPNVINHSGEQIKYGELFYRMRYENVDFIPYPTQGHAAEIFLSKQGFNNAMNLWQLTAKTVGYWRLGKLSYYSLGASGTLKVPFKQPYYNQQLLGYGDMFLRGYEYYVTDGVAGGFVNASVATRLTNFSFSLPFLKRQFPEAVPLKIYSKLFGNAGYVYNPHPGPTNRLPNRILFGGGIGFDIFTINNVTLKVEFSYNHLGENGIYLQKKEDVF